MGIHLPAAYTGSAELGLGPRTRTSGQDKGPTDREKPT